MARAAGKDAKKGNAAAYKKRIRQSKVLSLTGIGLGLLFITAILVVTVCDDFSFKQ